MCSMFCLMLRGELLPLAQLKAEKLLLVKGLCPFLVNS